MYIGISFLRLPSGRVSPLTLYVGLVSLTFYDRNFYRHYTSVGASRPTVVFDLLLF